MRRRIQLVVGAILVALALTFWACLQKSGPRYKGRSLNYWVHDYWPLRTAPAKTPKPEEAIRNIGTNALPFLLSWIQANEPSYRGKLSWRMSRLPDRLKPEWARSGYTPFQLQSAHAFKALGALAIPAVPQLAKIAADSSQPRAAYMALIALHQMGSNGIPALLAAAQDKSHPYRDDVIFLLGISQDLNEYQDTIVTNLIFALKDSSVNQSAASALGSLAVRPEIVVPTLAASLEDTNTAYSFRSAVVVSLIYFGEKSAPALPQLTNALSDPSPEVCMQATNAIKQIQLAIRRLQTK